MPKRTNDFQQLVKRIESCFHGTNALVKESEMIRDYITDENTEVDVLVTFDLGNRQYRTAIECRDHKRRQGPSWIRDLAGKRENCRLDRMVAVSTSGFTKGAIRQAVDSNIETIATIKPEIGDLRDSIAGPMLMLTGAFVRVIKGSVLIAVQQGLPNIDSAFENSFVRDTSGKLTKCGDICQLIRGEIEARLTPKLEPTTVIPPTIDTHLNLSFVLDFPEGTEIVLPEGTSGRIFGLRGDADVDVFAKWFDVTQCQYGKDKILDAEGKVLGRQVLVTMTPPADPRKFHVEMEDAKTRFTPASEEKSPDNRMPLDWILSLTTRQVVFAQPPRRRRRG